MYTFQQHFVSIAVNCLAYTTFAPEFRLASLKLIRCCWVANMYLIHNERERESAPNANTIPIDW